MEIKKADNPNWKRHERARKLFWIKILGVVLLAGLILSGGFVFWNSLPTELQLTTNAEGKGVTITVKAGGDLQSAITKAKAGDTILLQAGATFKGAFKLPDKAGAEFITIRTSADDAQLPPAGTRLDPKKYAAVLPKIVPNVNGEPAVLTLEGAHHYRFIGIEFAPTYQGLYNIIQLGSTEETKLEQLPHHIEFDRVYLHGDPNVGQRRGIAANGRYLKIINSYFSDFKREGEESQAIAMWATDGNIEIINNYLEAGGENILFGGAENKLKLVAADVLVKDNWMNKPPEWRGQKWVIKNFLEIKSGKRIKIENNLMTNNWAQAQEGTGVLFRSATDSGDQAVVEDITFTDNIMRSSGSALNIFGGEGKGGRNLLIRNNLFTDISAKKYEGRGFFIKSTTFDNVVIENNTVIHDGSISIAYGDPITKFVFRNNIVFANEYNFFGDGGTLGKATLAKFFPNAVVTNNIIIGGEAKDYPAGNFYPVSVKQIGFANADAGKYQLTPDNAFLKRGADGKQIGANLDPANVGGR